MHVAALHAYPVDRRLFGPLAGALSKPGIAVFSPDFRGRGTSRRPAGEVHGMDVLASDVVEDVLELVPMDEPFILLGVSMGGYVILEILRRYRSLLGGRLAGVALFDTRASADDDAGRAGREKAIAALSEEGMAAPLRDMLPNLLAPRSAGSAAEALVKEMILATPPAAALADQRGMLARKDGFDVLGALDVPLLLATGEEDRVTPESDAEAMADAASNAPFVRFLTIPRAGHLAVLERPDIAAEALSDLISRA